MNRLIDRLKIYFVVFFAICCVAVWTTYLIWVWPGQRCEAKGMWWDWRTRTCAMPVPLHVFTGRTPQGPTDIAPAPQPIKPQP
jgi:hypothetical protein